ncbi:DUF4175 domain-containing protein [Pseudomonas syringae pv. actinidiae]|nr:DUF4175 domain-containing protein [Pseudomonas syringae pv. actinidiae]
MVSHVSSVLMLAYCLVVGFLAVRGTIPLWVALVGLVLAGGAFAAIGWQP